MQFGLLCQVTFIQPKKRNRNAKNMESAGARVYNGGLGTEPPAGSKGRAPGQGVGGEAP